MTQKTMTKITNNAKNNTSTKESTAPTHKKSKKLSSKLLSYVGMLLLCCSMLTACGKLGINTSSAGKAADNGSDEQVGIHYLRQLVAQDNGTGRTLMWQADAKGDYSVEYRLVNGKTQDGSTGNAPTSQNNDQNNTNNASTSTSQNTSTIPAQDISFKEANGDYILYSASLDKLVPDNTYEYRINKDKVKGSWHKLTTDNKQGFTAIIFPDSQSSDYSGWTSLARAAYKRHADASLYVNMGDLVDNGQDYKQWQAWFRSVEPFSANVPLAPVIGNHEAYSLDWKTTPPVAYTHLFQTPANGLPGKYKNQFYSFDYGDVHFTVLDTNFDNEVKDYQPQLREDELAWLEKDLAASKAKWKIVLQHRDIMMYGFSPESGRPQRETRFIEVGKLLMPIFEKYKVDAVLSAHLHTYRRRVKLRNFQPSDDGITYILTGVAGNVRYPKLWTTDFAWDAKIAPQPETANYMTLKADEKALEFKCYLPTGEEIDSVQLTK